jgi:hypothetical protein
LLNSGDDFGAEIVGDCFERRGSIEACVARNDHRDFRFGLSVKVSLQIKRGCSMVSPPKMIRRLQAHADSG